MEWTNDDDTYLTGTENNGAGMYLQDGQWCGNVVYYGTMCAFGPRDSFDEIKKDCEAQLLRYRSEE